MITGQAKIAVTGTAVPIPLIGALQGVLVTAAAGNAAAMTAGGSGITNAADGTGNGYILPAGASAVIPSVGVNTLYVNGTAGDYVSYVGA